MDRQLIVEVLDRRGHVTSRHRLDAFPATLGRGYGCAVILDDRYVSPEHARIDLEADGGLVAVDLESLNGLHEPGRRRRLARLPIHPGTRLRLGQTVLRFCFSDQPVPPAVREVGDTLALGRFVLTPGRGLAIGTGAAAWIGLQTYLGTFSADRAMAGAATAIGLGVAIAVWAGIWALAGRLLIHRPGFSLHAGLAGLAILVSSGVDIISGYVEFLMPQREGVGVVTASLQVLVFGALLAGSLSLATALPRARRAGIGFGLAIVLAGLGALTAVAFDDDADRAARFEGELKALGEGWVRAVTPEEFFVDVERLANEVDELAVEEPGVEPTPVPDDSAAVP